MLGAGWRDRCDGRGKADVRAARGQERIAEVLGAPKALPPAGYSAVIDSVADDLGKVPEASGHTVVPLAVFDYDGTLTRRHSAAWLAMWLVTHRHLKVRSMTGILAYAVRYVLSAKRDARAVREWMYSGLLEMSDGDADDIIADFYDHRMRGHLLGDAKEEVRRRSEAGCVTVLLTGTFSEIARLAAKECGMDVCLATFMESRDDHYTGKVLGTVPEGRGKVMALTEYADARFGKGGWKVECAYGDHLSDIPVLEMAEHPVCVRGRGIRAYGRARGWVEVTWK